MTPSGVAGILLHGTAILMLTVITQVGGASYALALALRRYVLPSQRSSVLLLIAAFIPAYFAATAGARFLAPVFGRVALPCFASSSLPLASGSVAYCLLNRNYVSKDLLALATALSQHMDRRFPGTTTLTLDAGFPFFDGFPLLPHLSHDDGRKLDLAFYYARPDGTYARSHMASPIGYWRFEALRTGDPQPCKGRSDWLTLRWNMDWFQLFVDRDLTADTERNREALVWLGSQGRAMGLQKILLEPHLKKRWAITSQTVRFQGCRAARHDDHVHIQMR